MAIALRGSLPSKQAEPMEFHNYRTIRDMTKHGVPARVFKRNPDLICEQLAPKAGSGDDDMLDQARDERTWEGLRRPYYNVYPSIIPMLTRLNLAVDTNLVRLPMPSLCIRLPKDTRNPLKFASRGEQVYVGSILVTDVGETGRLTVRLDTGENRPGYMTLHPFFYFIRKSGVTMEQLLMDAEQEPVTERSGVVVPDRIMTDSLRLCCTLCLLDDNPELISPDVLTADFAKYEATGNRKYVDRAHSRGKFGWNVGRHIEVIPHYRRPHLALVWTGEGRKIAKIVPRKGSLIHRHAVETIPTGFQGETPGSADGQTHGVA
jgi:hypothetical protein